MCMSEAAATPAWLQASLGGAYAFQKASTAFIRRRFSVVT